MSFLRCALALALAAGTVAVFGATTGFDFVYFDDRRYILTNPWIADGLSFESFRWALSTFYVSNWHPLTWLSYALDVTLFGLVPGPFHAVNVALHVCNTLLVFALFDRATRAPWPSAAVAALFAWHPLHVEPVAWVAERKELIAAFFGLLACLSWMAFARRGGARRYAVCALCMALSLMAKPMWVTLPFLLLALDHWPLERLRDAPLRRLAEKLPLLALSAASSVITLAAQAGALETGSEVPLSGRIANAIMSPLRYLAKTLWPSDLSVLYPHPYFPGGTPFGVGELVGCVLLLVSLTAFALWFRPYLASGWSWFVLALVPVIGVVQVGAQAMADRYTYVPLLGVFFALAFGADEAIQKLREHSPTAARGAGGACLAVILLFALSSVYQVGAWRDTITLYERSIASTPTSTILRMNLGNRLLDVGREREAIEHYEAARALRPDWDSPNVSLAWLLATTDDPALFAPERALALARDVVETHGTVDPNILDTLAAAYAATERYDHAEAAARRAVQIARAAGRTLDARAYERRRRLYAAGNAYREALRPGEARTKGSDL